MKSLKISAWAGWLPGVFTKEEWNQFFEHSSVVHPGQDPLVPELPAMMRRRMGRMSRMSAAVAFAACRESSLAPSDVPLVFASRHGEMSILMGLLSLMSEGEPLSPTAFSHSVHHTSGSYFSIAAGNKKELRSVAGGEATFAYGFLDAVGLLHERENTHVLLLVADDRVPPIFEHLVNEARLPYAVGLVLSRDLTGPGMSVGFDCRGSRGMSPSKDLKQGVQALDFLQWLTGPEHVFESDLDGKCWRWSK